MQRVTAISRGNRQPQWQILTAKTVLSNALADVFDAQGHLLFIFYLQQQQKLLSPNLTRGSLSPVTSLRSNSAS